MIKRIEVTEDLLKLIPIIFVQEEGDDKVIVDKKHTFAIGLHLMEDMAMALGIYDRAIKGTEDDPEGYAFNEEDTEYMLKLHRYVVDNIFYIESLIHQYVTKGGLEVGTYKAKDNELIWEKES
jgi:transcription termination factor NusB